MVDFSGKQTEILRFARSRLTGKLLGSYLYNSHVREGGKQDLAKAEVELHAFVMVTSVKHMGNCETGMVL